jgi:hypothetical protein
MTSFTTGREKTYDFMIYAAPQYDWLLPMNKLLTKMWNNGISALMECVLYS